MALSSLPGIFSTPAGARPIPENVAWGTFGPDPVLPTTRQPVARLPCLPEPRRLLGLFLRPGQGPSPSAVDPGGGKPVSTSRPGAGPTHSPGTGTECCGASRSGPTAACSIPSPRVCLCLAAAESALCFGFHRSYKSDQQATKRSRPVGRAHGLDQRFPGQQGARTWPHAVSSLPVTKHQLRRGGKGSGCSHQPWGPLTDL